MDPSGTSWWFKTYHSEANDLKYDMYIVRAMDKDTMDMLTGIRGVCHTIVKWERMRKSPVTQCHNCYQFGHSLKGQCFNPRQCKRCLEKGDDHICTVELVTPTAENNWNVYADYTCCNCKQKGHPPTYKKCTGRDKALKNAAKAQEAKNRERSAKNATYKPAPEPQNNVWAERSKARPPQRPQPQVYEGDYTTSDGEFDLAEEIQRVLGIKPSALNGIAKRFIAKYATLTTQEEKGEALGLYYLEINQWRP